MTENHYLVPPQQDGLEKDLAHSILATTIEEAEDWFVDAKERLLAVNHWKKWSVISSDFRLADSHGSAVNRRARKGDYIRTDLPERDGGGFEWVGIEAIEYDDYPDISMETFAIRVRQAADPRSKKDNDTFGLYGSDATGTFVIERWGKRLTTSYHGRNEADDMDGHGVAVAPCAWLGLSDAQCAALIKGFVE